MMTKVACTPLTIEDLRSIQDIDLAFGTTRFLPPTDSIAEEMFGSNNYTRLVNALFFGTALPDFEIRFRPAFDVDGIDALVARFTRAHLASFEPKHEDKIAGVAQRLAEIAELLPAK